MDEYYRAVKALPAWLAAPLAQLPAQTAVRVQELRLRIGCAVTFTVQGRQCAASVLPGCPPALAAMRLDALQIEEIFYTLCNGSVHTHERDLAEGYLTTAAGNRVGVAGQFVQREGQSIALQKVTSLNLRIARSCAICLPPELDKLLEQHFTGLLVVGEPGSGKTTLLRTIARTLAERQRLVAVVDERGELFPPEQPLPPLERIGGVDKARAVQMALRTLAPQVILLDELGSLEETMALEQGFFSGVDFIASIHAPDAAQAQCRPQVQTLLQRGMLRQLVVLAGLHPGGACRMSSLLRGFSLLLLPLCGWLAGDAVQAKTTLHLAALQRTITLLQRIRQEIQYRRADLQSLYRQLCREGVLAQTHDGTLQQLPAPGQLSATERACFTECFGGLGRAAAAQECERLDYYTARFEDYLQQARRAAQRQAGLPHRLGLAGGMMLALLFL